ncbi:MAG: hypothetical protein JJE40_12000 [Vicinamibacteria bacterium]|nr:hypothetical protein [Vicinamibacteria bacterium]
MRRVLLAAAALTWAGTGASVPIGGASAPSVVTRFVAPSSPLALTGPARAGRVVAPMVE